MSFCFGRASVGAVHLRYLCPAVTHFSRHKERHQISSRPFGRDVGFGFLAEARCIPVFTSISTDHRLTGVVKDQILFLIVRLSRNLIEVGRARAHHLRVFNFTAWEL